MANPTSNFGWQMPTPVDLVTDLPADFEVFGQAVDTSLADLKGGTSGQVLSKNSNTDMDFVWVTSDDANAIQNSIVNAKGDLIGASANDTPAILSVGANGETLVADSSTSTGLRYQEPKAANPILNSSFQIAQRGTSGSNNSVSATGYNLDRWQNFSANVITISRQATGDTTNLPNIQYCARVQRNAGQTSTGVIYHAQSIETINSIPFAGKTVTISFYARAGANFSSTSNNLVCQVATGTGTDQNWLGGFTGVATPINLTSSLTTTWQRFQTTATLSASATEIAVGFLNTPTGTAGANDYYEVTGVQLEVGSVATPFKTNGATIQGELAVCQRYYFRYTPTSAGGPYAPMTSAGTGISTTQTRISIQAPVTMRVPATTLEFSTIALWDGASVTSISSMTLDSCAPTLITLNAGAASGLTQYRPYFIISNNSTSAYIGIGAEL